MKHLLILSLLSLGTVFALHPRNNAPVLESRETGAELSQNWEGSREQKGELALAEKEIQAEEEEVESSGYADSLEDEEAMESGPAALDEDLQCPREEDTVEVVGSLGCKTCHYWLVRTPRTFRRAQKVCRKCYHGNLASIHNYKLNIHIQRAARSINQGQVWIGGIRKCWCRGFRWIDGTCWNFQYWAARQPSHGRGRCVAMCTQGGHWRLNRCTKHLPFVCYS